MSLVTTWLWLSALSRVSDMLPLLSRVVVKSELPWRSLGGDYDR